MITQQMARYLLKKVDLVVHSSADFAPSNATEGTLFEYHKARSAGFPPLDIYLDNKQLVSSFRRRAAYLVS